MISDYQIDCPKCGYLKASHHREPNSLATYIDCPKCGLYKECRLPRADEAVVIRLFDYAKKRLAARSLIEWSRRLIAPAIYVVVVWFYFGDAKLIALLVGMFFMVHLSGPSSSVSKQLTYILRMVQHQHMMDGTLQAVLSDELEPNDVLHDYELSEGACGEDGVKKLDNRYYAFVRWMQANLRSSGFSEQAVARESYRYRQMVDKAVKARLKEAEAKAETVG